MVLLFHLHVRVYVCVSWVQNLRFDLLKHTFCYYSIPSTPEVVLIKLSTFAICWVIDWHLQSGIQINLFS